MIKLSNGVQRKIGGEIKRIAPPRKGDEGAENVRGSRFSNERQDARRRAQR